MKKLLLLLLFAGLLNTGSVFGWGREGHETIAKIAERNLTKKAKKRIEKYLGGHSIAVSPSISITDSSRFSSSKLIRALVYSTARPIRIPRATIIPISISKLPIISLHFWILAILPSSPVT